MAGNLIRLCVRRARLRSAKFAFTAIDYTIRHPIAHAIEASVSHTSSPFFEGRTLTVGNGRVDYDEWRFITIGLLAGHCVSVLHTETDETIRIISMRETTKYEQAERFKDFPSEDD